VDGHILQVLGDNADNNIVIADSRPSSIQVTCNGQAFPAFAGITDLQVSLGNGNNSVHFPWLTMSSLTTEIAFGDGNNLFVDDWSHAMPPSPDRPMPPMPMTITTGSGNNRVTELAPPPGFNDNVQFGNGNDQFTAVLPAVNSALAERVQPPATFSIQGGTGTDTVRVMSGDPEELPSTARALLTTPVDLQFMGGGGQSTLSVVYSNVIVDAAQSFRCPDDNNVQVRFHNAVVDAPVSVSFTEGMTSDGGTTVRIDFPVSDHVFLDGGVTMTAHGDRLGTDVRVTYDLKATPETSGRPSEIRGSVELEVPLDDSFAILIALLEPVSAPPT
jgi:hypothetical protein